MTHHPIPRLQSWFGAAVLALASTACSSATEPGVSVQVVAAQSLAPGQHLPLAGGVLRVDELRWTSAAVELEPCAGLSARLLDWLVPRAHAHGAGSPTELAVPTVISPLAGSTTFELTPGAGSYCGLHFHVGPADADAVGLDAAPEMRGLSFLLRGAHGPSLDDLRPFAIESSRALDIGLELEWELSGERREVRLTSRLRPELWSEQMGVSSSGGLSEEAVLAAFERAFEVDAR